MSGWDGDGVFINELKELKNSIQNQNFPAYSGRDETAYKAAMKWYVDKIYNMNDNYDDSYAALKEKLNQLGEAVTEVDAKDVNEQLSK